jgi:hypothetical protein
MNIETIKVNRVELVVEFDYDEGESPSRDCPGEAESFEIEAVTVDGIDIIDMLNDENFDDIIKGLKELREG